MIRLQQNRAGDAANLFRRAVKVDRNSADAHHHLGVALSALGRHEEAIERYEKALKLQPELPEAHNNIAHSYQALGRPEEAAAHYERALEIKPDYAEARNNFGTVLQAANRWKEAIAQYEKAVAIRPNYVEAHKNLGYMLNVVKHYREAAAHYKQALAFRPNDAEAHAALGDILDRSDLTEDAITHYKKGLAADPRCVEAHIGLGHTIHMLGKSEEAIRHYRQALAIRPTDAEAHNKLGDAMQALGRQKEAAVAFERALALTPRRAGVYWNLANSMHFTPGDPHFAAMTRLMDDRASLTVEEQIDLHFALSKALRELGDPQASFQQLLLGNSLMRRHVDYDETAALGRLERIQAIFTAELMHEKRGSGVSSNAPVFIVGMPRSGTTLIEQVLASHPSVFGAGELRVMASLAERIGDPDRALFPEAVLAMSGEQLRGLGGQYIHALQRVAPPMERITDKMPGNFALLGLIHLALPNARIIHVRRDPRDTAVSCFSQLFTRGHEFTYDLAELGRYIAAYERLMAHWRSLLGDAMLEISYEDVVNDFEREAPRIIAHCDLAWNDACLAFHATERSVRTASAAQVRQPIYHGSVGRWRAHEEQLKPLLLALEPSPRQR
jgi:tetratricopeptide (TPR) repeat protein